MKMVVFAPHTHPFLPLPFFTFPSQSLIFPYTQPFLQCLVSHPHVSRHLPPVSSRCSTDLGEVLLSHLHLLLHQPLPVGRLILEPPLGLLSPPPLLLQHLPPSLRLSLLGAFERRDGGTDGGKRGGKKTMFMCWWRGKLRRGQYVNFRQILQYKVNNCQRRHMRIKVPMQGFVKSIPQVCV